MSIKLFVELLWWTWPAYLWPPSYTHAFSQIITCRVQDEYLSVADPTSKPQGIHPNQQLQQQISISNTCSFFASLNQKLYVHKVVQVVHVWHVVCHFLWRITRKQNSAAADSAWTLCVYTTGYTDQVMSIYAHNMIRKEATKLVMVSASYNLVHWSTTQTEYTSQEHLNYYTSTCVPVSWWRLSGKKQLNVAICTFQLTVCQTEGLFSLCITQSGNRTAGGAAGTNRAYPLLRTMFALAWCHWYRSVNSHCI